MLSKKQNRHNSHADVTELAYGSDLKSDALGIAGSTPAIGTESCTPLSCNKRTTQEHIDRKPPVCKANVER